MGTSGVYMRLSTQLFCNVDGVAVDISNMDYDTMCALVLRKLGVPVPELHLSFYPRRIEEGVSKRLLLEHPSLGGNRRDPLFWVEAFANGFLGQLSEETNCFEKAGAEYRRQLDPK